MASSAFRGFALGSAFAAACSTSATLGVQLNATTSDGGRVPDAGDATVASDGEVPLPDGEVPPETADDARVQDDAASDGSPRVLPMLCDNYPRTAPPGGWESKAVFYGSDNKLLYAVDAEGNRIPDFSYAGYEYGADPPAIPQAVYVDAGRGFFMNMGGDDTARIQAAIDQVGARPAGPDGFRGAVVLGTGVFTLGGPIYVNKSGVVLRGSGHGADGATSTILLATGGNPSARVVLGSGLDNGWTDEIPGTRTSITTTVVAVGSRTFQVADAGRLMFGDNIIIVHALTPAWLAAVDGGNTGSDPAWTADLGPITFNRRVVGRRGNELTLDAPIFNRLDASLSPSYLYLTRRTNIVSHVGIENVWVDTTYQSNDIERHAANSIDVVGAEDAWIRDVTTIHFAYAGVRIQNGVRITIDHVDANDPMANRQPGRMHNFALDARAQLVLVTQSHAQNGRHHFFANSAMNSSGNVILRSSSQSNMDDESTGSIGPFSQGLLFDNVAETGGGSAALGCTTEVGLANAHGWSAAHSVLWNYHFDRGHGAAEKPPTGQNYAIGRGPLSGKIGACVNTTEGFVEQNVGPLRQESLYEAQLCDRLRP
jgi:hypothetical protein